MNILLNKAFNRGLCKLCLIAIGVVCAVSSYAQSKDQKAAEAPKPVKLTRVGKVEFPSIDEMSGIIKSRQYKNVYWVHNDSGDKPRLFAINARNAVVMPVWLKGKYTTLAPNSKDKPAKNDSKRQLWPGLEVVTAANIDWEDITTDGTNLYIGDVGNNGNARRDLGIYVLTEPDPRSIDRARPLKFWPIRYPDQKQFPAAEFNFDCESIFWFRGKLYFITKHRKNQTQQLTYGGKLYRLDNPSTDKVNVLTKIAELPKLSCATAAQISPDNKKLAVLTILGLWVFETPDKGDNFFASKPRVYPFDMAQTKQIEAICFDDNDTVRLTNEQRDIFTLKLTDGAKANPDSDKKTSDSGPKKTSQPY